MLTLKLRTSWSTSNQRITTMSKRLQGNPSPTNHSAPFHKLAKGQVRHALMTIEILSSSNIKMEVAMKVLKVMG